MKTVHIIPYYAIDDYWHKRTVNRLVDEFSNYLRKLGFKTTSPKDGLIQRVINCVTSPYLTISVGFSRFTDRFSNANPHVIIEDRARFSDVRLATTYSAALAGSLNRGLLKGDYCAGVLSKSCSADEVPVKCDKSFAVMLGHYSDTLDQLAVNRNSSFLFKNLAQSTLDYSQF